jgi:hypothetical protein
MAIGLYVSERRDAGSTDYRKVSTTPWCNRFACARSFIMRSEAKSIKERANSVLESG